MKQWKCSQLRVQVSVVLFSFPEVLTGVSKILRILSIATGVYLLYLPLLQLRINLNHCPLCLPLLLVIRGRPYPAYSEFDTTRGGESESINNEFNTTLGGECRDYVTKSVLFKFIA